MEVSCSREPGSPTADAWPARGEDAMETWVMHLLHRGVIVQDMGP